METSMATDEQNIVNDLNGGPMATTGRPVGRPSNAEKARRKRDINERQWAYVLWCARGPSSRTPRTKEEFAKVVGVTSATLRNWDQQETIQVAIRQQMLRNAADPERVGVVVEHLYDRITQTAAANDLDMKAVETFARITGLYDAFKRQADLTVEIDNSTNYSVTEMSDEELNAIYSEYLAEQQEDAAVAHAAAKLG